MLGVRLREPRRGCRRGHGRGGDSGLAPCIVIAGEVLIGSREMRTMGIEAAYPVRESQHDDPQGEVSADELGDGRPAGGQILSW